MLDYNPKVTFEEGIARTSAWYDEAYHQGLFHHEKVVAPVSSPKKTKPLPDHNATIQHSNSDDSNNSGKVNFNREASDLELSSFVQKASKQCKSRTRRIF